MIDDVRPFRKHEILCWFAAIAVANMAISLDYRLSWVHMGMATVNLTAGLLLWQMLLARMQGAKTKRSQAVIWMMALGVPLFFTGLIPWGAAHWYNTTLFAVLGTGTIAAAGLAILRWRTNKKLCLPLAPLILSVAFTVVILPVWFAYTAFQFPHHHSASPAITLSGTSPNGQFRLRAIPGAPVTMNDRGYLKWSVVVEEHDGSGEWQQVFPRGEFHRLPLHMGGHSIEGQRERSLLARWTGENRFEISYLHRLSSGTYHYLGEGERRFVYRCTIERSESDNEYRASCQRSIKDPVPLLFRLMGRGVDE